MKKRIEFPIFKTKIPSIKKQFDLTSPNERKEYFQAKAGSEIEKIRSFLDKNTFICYLLAKKGAGKGTISKLFSQVIGDDYFAHLSVGDIVRKYHKILEGNSKEKGEVLSFLEKNYRGYISLDKAINSLLGRSASNLLPTEFILALVKREINLQPKKSLFLDGFPRSLDQVSYSLYFRELINYRDDMDFFVLLDVAESVIDERIKYRTVCPLCNTPRNLKLLPTSFVGFDKVQGSFYLMCENPNCKKIRMIKKEGDELGIETIKKRLDNDGDLLQKALSLYGIDKVLLRNTIPVGKKNLVDEYEITPEFYYREKNGIITKKTKPFTVKDDNNQESYSLMPEAVTLSLIKQIADLV